MLHLLVSHLIQIEKLLQDSFQAGQKKKNLLPLLCKLPKKNPKKVYAK